MLTLVSLALTLILLTHLTLSSLRRRRLHNSITSLHSCLPPPLLPNKPFPPFGLDKLSKVLSAERTRTYPLLMRDEHDLHGDTYAQWGGPVYTILTRDPLNIREILHVQFESESRLFSFYFIIGHARHGCVRPLVGDGIFTQDGGEWERSRKMLAGMVMRPALPDLGLVEKHFRKLLREIVGEGTGEEEGITVNLSPHLFDLSLNLTTEFLLGDPGEWEGAQEEVYSEAFAASFAAAWGYIARRERLKGLYWLIDGPGFRAACKEVHGHVDAIVERSREALVRQRKEKRRGKKLGDEGEEESYVALAPLLMRAEEVGTVEVRDQFLGLLLAGRDTSGSLLCWILYALGREPKVQEELREEIRKVVGGEGKGEPAKDDMRKMTLLERFITEVLRVFPPVPINGRLSTRATFLPRGGGPDGSSPILVPQGTLIAFSTFATQRSSALYGSDANTFRVDRWTHEEEERDEKERRTTDWSYHPFVGGRRKCLGERTALVQAKYLTCRLLQHFREIVPTNAEGRAVPFKAKGEWVEDVKYHVGLTMSPDDGVWLRLVPAN